MSRAMATVEAPHGPFAVAGAAYQDRQIELVQRATTVQMGDEVEMVDLEEARRHTASAYHAIERLIAYQKEHEDPNHERLLALSRGMYDAMTQREAMLVGSLQESQERQAEMIHGAFADLRALLSQGLGSHAA